MQAFIYTLAFLTRLPIPGLLLQEHENQATVATALLWYPLVGALIAAILILVCLSLPASCTPLLAAAIVVSLQCWLTGALHLDGLADSIDAWMGGHADPDKTLAIMQDPAAGPMAVVGLCCILLLKVAALAALWPDATAALFAALVLSRASVIPLFLSSPYVRAGGIGEAMSAKLNRSLAIAVCIATLLALSWLPSSLFLGSLVVLALVFLYWRHLWQGRIGGFTGDVAGGMIELTETSVLLVFALGGNYA